MSHSKAINTNSYTLYNNATLIPGGETYFTKLEELIDNAVYSLHFQTYIYEPDETGRKVADALIRAAVRNVKVYLMVDGFASSALSQNFVKQLKDAGIHFSFFQPFFSSRHFYIGRRLHHKAIVADACKCIVGGINISNNYNDIIQNTAWLDWAIYSEGEAAYQLHAYCTKMWNKENPADKYYSNGESYPIFPHQKCLIRIRKNDWINRHTEITNSYKEMFIKADKQIDIMSSYFWPPKRLLKQIAKASARGVKIKLVLAGRSDIKLAKFAERYMYEWLLKKNVELYEYQGNILHSKIATYDNKWVTIGSYNVNNISAYASIELNLDIKDTTLAIAVSEMIENTITANCIRILPEKYRGRNFFYRSMHTISYYIIQWVFVIFTWYFKQSKMVNTD